MSASHKLEDKSSPKEVAYGVFRFLWDDRASVTLRVSRDGRDGLTFEVAGKTFTDRGDVRGSDTTRKRLASKLQQHGLLFEREAYEMLNAVASRMADAAKNVNLEKLAVAAERMEEDIRKVIENDIDVNWLLQPQTFERAIQLVKDSSILGKVCAFIRTCLVADWETIENIVFQQASVCAPVIRRYSLATSDFFPERGQECFLLYKRPGTGGGAYLKLLRLIGVRVLVSTRMSEAFLMRTAGQLLNHVTLFIPEAETVYRQVETRQGRVEQATQVAQALKQAIEDNKIALLVMDHDEEGRLVPKVVVSDVYPAAVMTSINEIQDVQWTSRFVEDQMPSQTSSHMEIGATVARGVSMRGSGETGAFCAPGLSASDVKLVFHFVNAATEGCLHDAFQQLKGDHQKNLMGILEKHGLTVDHLKPVSHVEFPREAVMRLFKAWMSMIVELLFPQTMGYEGEEGVEEVKRSQILELIEQEKFEDAIDLVRLIEGDLTIEACTRDLLHGIRRGQSSCLLLQFQRQSRVSEGGGKRVLTCSEEDASRGVDLVKRLLPSRVKALFTSYELSILKVLTRKPMEKTTAKQVASAFYKMEEPPKNKVDYVRRVLKKATETGFLNSQSGKPLMFWYDPNEAKGLVII